MAVLDLNGPVVLFEMVAGGLALVIAFLRSGSLALPATLVSLAVVSVLPLGQPVMSARLLRDGEEVDLGGGEMLRIEQPP